jgi:capsular polysaccharide biosynthesis protein
MQRASAQDIDGGCATIFFGAFRNYGHFVLDTMTSVAAIENPVYYATALQRHCQHFQLLNI